MTTPDRAHTARILLATSLLLLALVGACVPPGEDVPFESVLHRADSLDFMEPESFVLRSAEAWCDFWADAHSSQTEPPACEPGLVDFDHETVLAVTVGSRPNGCYGIAVDAIVTGEEPGSVTVFVREQVPGPGCLCTQAFTSPTEAVVVANPVGSVDFVHEVSTLPCE